MYGCIRGYIYIYIHMHIYTVYSHIWSYMVVEMQRGPTHDAQGHRIIGGTYYASTQEPSECTREQWSCRSVVRSDLIWVIWYDMISYIFIFIIIIIIIIMRFPEFPISDLIWSMRSLLPSECRLHTGVAWHLQLRKLGDDALFNAIDVQETV